MSGKKAEFKLEITFRRVDKIPISKTPSEIEAMDFADYVAMRLCSFYKILFRAIR